LLVLTLELEGVPAAHGGYIQFSIIETFMLMKVDHGVEGKSIVGASTIQATI